MSFLNPVNEPVLRFKSTDAGAPQIDYNARVAGDVKTVLKACLVTGYGATASAGWSIANEVDHVAEFVSPSAAMSDYRLGIDDTSTSSTTWYYQYQDVRVNPSYNTPTKSFSYADKSNPSNGWELLATERGVYYIEYIFNTYASAIVSRITYFGQIKNAVSTQKNIAFFNTGHQGSSTSPNDFFVNDRYNHLEIDGHTKFYYFGPIYTSATSIIAGLELSNVDISSALYITTDNGVFIGQQPAFIAMQKNNIADYFGSKDIDIDGRSVLQITLGTHSASNTTIAQRSRVIGLRLDYWEY